MSASIHDMTEDVYHADPAVSKSKLSDFLDSSRMYYEVHEAGTIPRKASTKQMDTGSIVHGFLLDGKTLEEMVAVVPRDCLNSVGAVNSRGDNYKAFIEENEGKYIVKSDQIDAIGDCLEAVMRSDLYELVKDSHHREQSIFWTDEQTGLRCRCRPDFFLELDGVVYCCDLKVTPAVHPDAWRRHVKRFRYWLQDAHYSEGLRALYGKPVAFRFWLVEPTPPYRIVPRVLDENHCRTVAGERWRDAMIRFADCKTTGNWDDQWSEVTVLNEWDFGEPAEEQEVIWNG